MFSLALVCASTLLGARASPPDAQLAREYVDAVHELNEKHARAPGKETEEELAKKLPPAAGKALEALLAAKPSAAVTQALRDCSEAALDLDRIGDFQKLRARLAKDAPADAGKLDTALSRPRFLLRGVGGLDEDYLKAFAPVLEGVLAAYDEVFGFAEFSKVPGKKLRVRLRLVEKLTAPPHFAPEFAYHSEIDFPVVDAKRFSSPDAEGHFFFYGLCHELGHVIAMWDLPGKEVDHHTWAHYCGVTIVEHLAQQKPAPPWLKDLRDANWRTLEKERAEAQKQTPGIDTDKAMMATWVALHDRVGPKAIGEAINALDLKDERQRINRVRYYKLEELKKALLAVVAKDKDKLRAVQELLP
jgi:hypothetical protein